ncbi:uncharacterized protein [Notamacropus eugenii]|uniref:uncharacterized protein isoform X2 n=1 Tax=Notamacropus eugenii TaxID=9315 RepID=UPI003B67C287
MGFDLVQFPQNSHWHQATSVLLPCPPHRISPLWEKDHLSQTEQIYHFDHQARITPKSPPHSYYYQNELVSSPWLKHLATATELSQSFARAKAMPLPHLYHQDISKVSPTRKYQKVTSVLPLHNRYDIKDKIALKSFQHEVTSSVSDHLPKIFPSYDHPTENLLSFNQQLPSPSFFDNKTELSSFLGHRSMTEERIYPDFQVKDKPSVISMSPGNQAKVARRPQSQVRAATATTLRSFDLRHTATITSSSLCFSHWSRATELKTPVLDHWVQAKASKTSYPDFRLRETVSLLRYIDHHSRPLTAYLNQKPRATTANSSFPKHCAKGTSLPSPSSNFQARTRSDSSQGVKPWDNGSASQGVTATSEPSSLQHQMAEVPAKQTSTQSTPKHQITCPPSSEDYLPYMTDPSTRVLLQKEKDLCEVMPQDLDYQFTVLTGQVYWATPPLNTENNDTAPPNCDKRATAPFSQRYQTENEPDPKAQVILQSELDDLETISLEADYEVTHCTGQDQWETPSQSLIDPQDTTLSGLEQQTTLSPSKDHQTENIAVDSSAQIIFHQEQDEWETIQKRRLDHQSTPLPNNDHQAQDTPEDSNVRIILKEELYDSDTIQRTRLDHQVTLPPENDHKAQDMPADHSVQVIFHQEADKGETFRTQELNHQSTPPPSNDHQPHDTPEDSSVHTTLKQEPDNLGPFWTKGPDHQATPPPGNNQEAQDIPVSSSEGSSKQKIEEWETFWPIELHKQSTNLTSKIYLATTTLDLKYQERTSPDPHHGATPSPSHEDQASDISDLSTQGSLQQELGKRETFWPTELNKITTLKDKDYWTTSPCHIKHQDRTSLDFHNGSTPPPSHEDQASDVWDLSTQAIIQQEMEEWNAFWPKEVDQQTTTRTDKVYWAMPTLNLKHQDRISPDSLHGITPPPSYEDQASDVSDLSAQATLQQELGKRETSCPIDLDKQATTITDKVYWAASLWDLKHQDRISPDLQQEATPPSSHDDQDSDVTDLSSQVTLLQETDKCKTFWPIELNKQATTLTDQVYRATSTLDLKHQNRISPDIHHGATSPPRYGNKASDVSELNIQATLQEELGEREKSHPTELDKQATTLNDNVHRATSTWYLKHEDRASFDLHHEAIPPLSHGDKVSDVTDLSAQAIFQQELGERETSDPTELDKRATNLTDKAHWATSLWDLKHQDRNSPDLHSKATYPPRHEDQGPDIPDLSAQVTIQQELIKTETFWPAELDKQTITLTDKAYQAASPWNIKHQDRTSPDLHHGATPPSRHEDQASDVSDLGAQSTLQQDLGKRETSRLKELDKHLTTLTDKAYQGASPSDIKHQERTSPDLLCVTTSLPRHENQGSDVSDLSAQATLQQELGEKETFWPIKMDQQATGLPDGVYWSTSPWDIKHQDRTSPDLHCGATPPPRHGDMASDISNLGSQATLQQELGETETSHPTELDKQATTVKDKVYWATFPQDMKYSEKTSPDLHHEAISLLGHENKVSDVSDLSAQATLQQELIKRETFWPIELDKQAKTLTDKAYQATALWDIKHQKRISPDPHHGSTLPSSGEDQASDVSDLSAQTMLQQEIVKRETFWPTELDKQTIILTDKAYQATALWDIKHQDRMSPDLHHGSIPPSRDEDEASDVTSLSAQATLQQELGERETSHPTEVDIKHQDRRSPDLHHGSTLPSSHEDQDSNVSDLGTQATIQQKLDEWETFWPTEVDQQTTTLTDKVDSTTPTLDLEYQERTSPNLHHGATPPLRHEEQVSDVSDLSVLTTLQQELEKKGKISCPKQATTLTDEVYWATSPSDIKHQDKTSPDLQPMITYPSSHEIQNSNVSDLINQVIIQQELDEWETFWPIEVDQQATTLTDKAYWATSTLDLKHQNRISPDPQHGTTPPLRHDDKASDVSDLSGQLTFQQELDEREKSHPTELDKQATTQNDNVRRGTTSWDLKHQDRTLSDPIHETTPPLRTEDQASDVSEISAQVILPQELGIKETSWPIEVDHQATTLKDKIYWVTPTLDLKQQERTLPDPHHGNTTPLSHEDNDSDTSDLKAQVILQEKLDEWETSCPTELDKQVTSVTDKAYRTSSTWDIKHQDRTLLVPQPVVTYPFSHEEQDSHVSDLGVHITLQQELNEQKTFWSTELDKQVTTLKDKDYLATSILDQKPPERTSALTHGTTPPSRHENHISDVTDLSAQVTLHQESGEEETFWPTEVDQQATTLKDKVFWATSPWDIKHQDRTSPETDHTTSPSSSHKNQDVNVTEPNAQVTLQPKLEQWEIMPSVLDQEVTNPTIQHSQTGPSVGIMEPQNTVLSNPEHQTIFPSNNDHQVGAVPEPSSKVTLQQGQDNWDTFWTRLDYQDTPSLNNDYQTQDIPGPKAKIIQKEREDRDIFWTRTLEYQVVTPTNQDALSLLGIEHHNMMQPDPDYQTTCTTSPDHEAEDITDPNAQGIFQQDSQETMPQEIEHQAPILTTHNQEVILPLSKNHQDTTLPGPDNQNLVLSIHDSQNTNVPGPNTPAIIQPEQGHWELIPLEIDHMAIKNLTIQQQEATPSLSLDHEDTIPSNSMHWATSSLIT